MERAFDSITHCHKTAPSEATLFFLERGNSENTNVQQECFFCYYALTTSMANLVKCFHIVVILSVCLDTPSENTGV